jgi:nucleoid-associated protein YgaU
VTDSAAGSTPAPAPGAGQAAPGAQASPAGAGGNGTPGAEPPPNTAKWREGRPGNVNPCNTPDPGWGIYDHWTSVSIGQMIAPQVGGLTKDGGFDLLVHFHGHEPIRKEFVKTAKGIVLVGIDLGIGSGPYGSVFASPEVFQRLLRSVEAEMARRSGRKSAHVRKLALSSWSAGYGAIEQILRQPVAKRVDAVILLDSLHAGYVSPDSKTLATAGLEPFVAFAKQAARGTRFMFQSYSSIIPPGYASTTETAHYVIAQLGGKPSKAKRDDVLGLDMFERFDRGKYHARGYQGEDKPDHCAHIGLMKTVVGTHLNKRWNGPVGKARRGAPHEKKLGHAVPAGATVHVVAQGQSLRKIARRYDVSVDAIREANGLGTGSKIQPGQQLVIPKPRTRHKPKPPPAPDSR